MLIFQNIVTFMFPVLNVSNYELLCVGLERGTAAAPPTFGPCLLWPNGWMDQDGTWFEVGLGPGDIVLEYPPPPKNGGHSSSPLFGPCLLWSNGWMDQDITWYRGRPRPRRQCVRWRPSSPMELGTTPPPHFSAHICCG